MSNDSMQQEAARAVIVQIPWQCLDSPLQETDENRRLKLVRQFKGMDLNS